MLRAKKCYGMLRNAEEILQRKIVGILEIEKKGGELLTYTNHKVNNIYMTVVTIIYK